MDTWWSLHTCIYLPGHCFHIFYFSWEMLLPALCSLKSMSAPDAQALQNSACTGSFCHMRIPHINTARSLPQKCLLTQLCCDILSNIFLLMCVAYQDSNNFWSFSKFQFQLMFSFLELPVVLKTTLIILKQTDSVFMISEILDLCSKFVGILCWTSNISH